jgi:RNA polymerase primary sigma factor
MKYKMVTDDVAERLEEYLDKNNIPLSDGPLSDRDSEIVRMRFGIGSYHQHTLQEIADHMSLTKERVRQIVSKSLENLGANIW